MLPNDYESKVCSRSYRSLDVLSQVLLRAKQHTLTIICRQLLCAVLDRHVPHRETLPSSALLRQDKIIANCFQI